VSSALSAIEGSNTSHKHQTTFFTASPLIGKLKWLRLAPAKLDSMTKCRRQPCRVFHIIYHEIGRICLGATLTFMAQALYQG
jgi:hypothetical protein